MVNSGIGFNLRKKHITIKVSDDVEFKAVINILKKKLPEFRVLYKNNEPEIDIIGKEFKDKEMSAVQKLINKFFEADVNFSSSKMLGLHSIRKTFKKEIAVSRTKFYRTSLRSGQKIQYEGSIVVLGDVNYGAEVIAGENIIVLGILRGLAHAGARGNKEAIISAGSIQSNQIRIANIIRGCEKEEYEGTFVKTNAYLNERNEVVIE